MGLNCDPVDGYSAGVVSTQDTPRGGSNTGLVS